MDILTHTLSGVITATGIAGLGGGPLGKRFLVIGCGAAGAALPDIDAITRWAGFDATIGKWLNLQQSGRAIYFSNLWYSHHNFCHSLAAGVLFTLVLALALHPARKRTSATTGWPASPALPAAFLLGFCMHLLGDLPTPDSVWHGIKILWPHSEPVGGFGQIWWWNNYDIFLLLLAGCGLNILILLLNAGLKKRLLNIVPLLLCIAVLGIAVYQITHRPIRFSGHGVSATHAQKERRSLAIQKSILGDPLYQFMVKFDRRLGFPF